MNNMTRREALKAAVGTASRSSASSAARKARKPCLATLAADLEKAGLAVDYVACVDAETLEPRKKVEKGCCVLVAAYDGKTRLIDNILI